MLKRIACAAALTLAIAMPAAAQQPSGKGAKIRYQVYQSTAEVLMRAAQQFCPKYDLVCEPVFIPSSSQGLQALAGNSLDIIYVGTDFGIRAISNGADIKIVSGASDRINLQVVNRKDVAFPNMKAGFAKMMKDYEGKKVGISARGATSEIAFDLMMRSAGAAPEKVTFIGVGGPTTALGALKSKQVDAVMLFQPLPAICDTGKDLCQTAIDLTREDRPPVMQQFDGAGISLFSSGSLMQKNPEALKAYIAATKDAEAWLRNPANYEKAKALVKGYLDLSAMPNADQILEVGLKEQIGNTNTKTSVSGVRNFIKTLDERKLLGKPVQATDVIWSEALVDRK
jgi:NitT/TauT family transport system substrate-binding protein